ncbi:hypothetical protein [Mycolicibacterium cosmeticum]|uniref:hypothetical protein n=2 Tax=Mycobacteriaceae TaxID=1762 RepID=UPI003204B29C
MHVTGWPSALRGAVRRRSVCRTVPAAAIVGSTLFMVNLFSSVRDDPFTWVQASQIMLTFLVPWLNATMGIAIGLRHGDIAPTPEAG